MTCRRDHLDTTPAIVLSARELPFADRLNSALTLGDLVVAGAVWTAGRIGSRFAGGTRREATRHPAEPCGVC